MESALGKIRRPRPPPLRLPLVEVTSAAAAAAITGGGVDLGRRSRKRHCHSTTRTLHTDRVRKGSEAVLVCSFMILDQMPSDFGKATEEPFSFDYGK